eukprot:scaffold4973_cov135-Cylindrotheca_fusiformis.AAC.24
MTAGLNSRRAAPGFSPFQFFVASKSMNDSGSEFKTWRSWVLPPRVLNARRGAPCDELSHLRVEQTTVGQPYIRTFWRRNDWMESFRRLLMKTGDTNRQKLSY